MTKFASLVKTFADNIVAQTAATESGSVGKANTCAKRYLAAFIKLREQGDEGRQALAPLLDHERPDVRVMTAVFLLRYCEEKSRAVLEAEARGNGMVAFGARQALLRWEEGKWSLDPES